MVRDQMTRICGIRDENCFINVEAKFTASKDSCACYDPCKAVKYDVQAV
jgi:hypothetical protein